MPTMQSFPDAEFLTRDALEEWAGERIFSRGRRYQLEGRVVDLALRGGVLLADVEGTEVYGVAVSRDEDGRLHSSCTCPYAVDCKHGVAALLECLERLRRGSRIEEAGDDDKRLLLLNEPYMDAAPAGTTVKKSPSTPDGMLVEAYLQGLDKKQLVARILSLLDELPEARADLHERALAHSGNAKGLRAALRREIRRVSSQEAWSDSWSRCRHIPDYSGVRRKMLALLAADQADALLEVGGELLHLGIAQIERSDDEGETCEEISRCVSLLADALRSSTLPPEAQVLWALNAVLNDNYGICDALESYLREEHPKDAWNAAVGELLARRAALVCDGRTPTYQRSCVCNWLVHALEHAEREAEILPLCREEARNNAAYTELVSRLILAGRHAEAESWIVEGVRNTREHLPGIAAQLHDQLRSILAAREDWPALVLLETEEFLGAPGKDAFTVCREAAGKLNLWPALRRTLLAYLAEGTLPWLHPMWPLPGLSGEPDNRKQCRYPMRMALIDIAMLEDQPTEVLKWFDALRNGGGEPDPHLCDSVASAVRRHAPARATALWKELAERAIARVSPHAYAEAGGYLRKAFRVLREHGQEEPWRNYLTALRRTHFRKKRLLEVLDQLEQKLLSRDKL